jgi:acyl carrier protein|tara:strand:- start:133 stop:366 length:234 start_codon:yes stop_codon:yes gene_type:complete
MKNSSKLKLIKDLLKILKVKDKKKLLIIKRKNFDKWDSLTHLQVIFFLEKNIKKKIPIQKLNKISTGKELIKIIDDN